MGAPKRDDSVDINDAILKGLHEATDWGIRTTDAQMRGTGWSRWLGIHTGRPADRVVGRDLIGLFPELAASRLGRFYEQVLGGQAVVLSQRLHGHFISIER